MTLLEGDISDPSSWIVPVKGEEMTFRTLPGHTGALKHMLPDGAGRFEGTGAGQSRYVWDGGWSEGRPSGKGTLIRENLTASVEGEAASGLYSGEGTDGIPDG